MKSEAKKTEQKCFMLKSILMNDLEQKLYNISSNSLLCIAIYSKTVGGLFAQQHFCPRLFVLSFFVQRLSVQFQRKEVLLRKH